MGELERQRLDRAALAFDLDPLSGFDPMLFQDRWIFASFRRLEAIAETPVQKIRRARIEIGVNALTLHQRQRPQIVDAVGVVGVLVGEDHPVEPLHFGAEQLLAEIRRSVDQRRGAARACGFLDEKRAAAAAVFRVCRVARAPALSHARNAAGGAAAEDGEGERHQALGTLEKRRKKFALLIFAMASKLTPRVSASTRAVSAT